MSSNSQIKKVSSQSQFDMSLSTFDCPICMEILQPPIFLCNSGHSICGSCKENLVNCPTCRDPILPMRNFQLEGIINRSVKVECKYCAQKFKIGELEAHQKACNSRPIDCVTLCGGCNEKGINPKEYSKHLINIHNFEKRQPFSNSTRFILKLARVRGVTELTLKNLIKVEELNFVVKFTNRDEMLYIWIGSIEEGDEKQLDQFAASISIFENDPAKEGVKFHCKVYSIRKTFEDLEPEPFPIKLSSLYRHLGLGPENLCVLAIDIQKRTINI